jgi:hypothetical protein
MQASLFTNRAIAYRAEKGFEHMKVALSVGVQKMVRSDVGCAGVIFTLDPETGFRDVVMITRYRPPCCTCGEQVANRNIGWGIAHAAVSRRPPISLNSIVALTEDYTNAAKAWALCFVQGPSSVAPCQTLHATIRKGFIADRHGRCVCVCSAYGLGENIVQGSVNPDEWLVFKPLMNAGLVPEEEGTVYTPIIRRHLGEKAIKMIYNKDPVRVEAPVRCSGLQTSGAVQKCRIQQIFRRLINQ